MGEEESDSEEYEDVMSFTLTPDKEHVNSLSESQYIFEASVRNVMVNPKNSEWYKVNFVVINSNCTALLDSTAI